jgi:hypothetical protein
MKSTINQKNIGGKTVTKRLKTELGVYKMLDTLKTVKKFQQIYNLVQILGSGYIQVGHFDYGPFFSSFGFE